MAREKDSDETSESNPDEAGPGAAIDEALERGLGIEPGEQAPGTAHAAPAAEAHEAHEPSEHSYWPIVVAASVLLIGIGFLSHLAVIVIGAGLLMLL